MITAASEGRQRKEKEWEEVPTAGNVQHVVVDEDDGVGQLFHELQRVAQLLPELGRVAARRHIHNAIAHLRAGST